MFVKFLYSLLPDDIRLMPYDSGLETPSDIAGEMLSLLLSQVSTTVTDVTEKLSASSDGEESGKKSDMDVDISDLQEYCGMGDESEPS